MRNNVDKPTPLPFQNLAKKISLQGRLQFYPRPENSDRLKIKIWKFETLERNDLALHEVQGCKDYKKMQRCASNMLLDLNVNKHETITDIMTAMMTSLIYTCTGSTMIQDRVNLTIKQNR